MNTVLSPLLCRGVLVFMDDILVHSATLPDHIILLRQVLSLLKNNDLKAKLSKYTFAQNSLSYLGHQFSVAGVSTLPKKIQAVETWPQSASVKELWGFLGLAGYTANSSGTLASSSALSWIS